jgi:hypothetical protein
MQTNNLVLKPATWWRHSSLTEPRSVIGAIAVVAVIVMFTVVIPFVNDNLNYSIGFDDAGRWIVDDYTAIRLADGWRIESTSELFTTVTDGKHLLILVDSREDSISAVEELRKVYDSLEQDADFTLTPIKTFTTDTNGDAAGYRSLSATDPSGNGTATYVVSQNNRIFNVSATGPADLDDVVYDQIEVMIQSTVISIDPREES